MIIASFNIVAVLASLACIPVILKKGIDSDTGLDIQVSFILLFALNSIYNLFMVMEWAGISNTFERSEDLTGALIPMMWMFSVYTFTQHIDRSRLKNSEQRYSQFISDLPVGVCRTETEPSDRFILVNDAMADIFGCPDIKILLAKNPSDFYQDQNQRKEFVNMVLRTGLVQQAELTMKKLDGSPMTGRITAQAVIDEKGNPVYIDEIVMDVTDQKIAEEKNKALMEQLIQAQKLEAIGTLAGGIAHDFNNILSASLGYTELAMDAVPESDEKLQEHLSQVMAAGNRAKDLVKQILQFSRHTESGFSKVNMKPILKEVLQLLKASLPATITINTQIEAQSDTIFADPGKIHQVLMNLCTNAFHAMKDQGGTLDIYLYNETLKKKAACYGGVYLEPGEYAVLGVEDSGCGMMPDVLELIFNPYFTTKARGEGTGLGLAITKNIIKSHGGGIMVSSVPSQGTRFNVYFPVKSINGSETELSQEEIVGGSEHILFVDDEGFFSDLFSTMLSKFGYQVTTSTDSREALAIFSNEPSRFNLLITDQTMPGMTGLELSGKIHQIQPDFPVIICSGFSEDLQDKTGQDIGVSAILNKPVTRKELALSVRKVLDKKQAVHPL